MNGVVKKVLVNTNDVVNIGMELVKLDDLNFKSQYEINLQELEVAEAELLGLNNPHLQTMRQKQNSLNCQLKALKKSKSLMLRNN